MYKLIALFALVAVVTAEPDPQWGFPYPRSVLPIQYAYPRAATTYGNGFTMLFMFKQYTCFETAVEPPTEAPAAFKKKRSAEADPQYVVSYGNPRVPVVYTLPKVSTYGVGHPLVFKFTHCTCFEVQVEPPPEKVPFGRK
jgi:hypothetical protein